MNNRESYSIENLAGSLLESWSNQAPWELLSIKKEGDHYIGHYHVAIDSELNSKAPHKSILHGTSMFTIAIYHLLSSVLHIVLNKAHPAFQNLPPISYEELRRRFMITSADLSWPQPIFDSNLVLSASLTKVTNKYSSHKLIFLELLVDVNEGKQQLCARGCLNLRDELI